MRIGVPYRLGDGPLMVEVPMASVDGCWYCTMAIPFEGMIRNAYIAGQMAASQLEEIRFMTETGIEKAERMGLL